MARRFAMSQDFLQSVPKKARQAARANAFEGKPSATPEKPAKVRTTARKHAARMLGAATLASLLSFALFASPGENPAYHTRVYTDEKTLAKGLNKEQNPIHALTQADRKKQNERSKARGIVREAGSD
jgi:hypothetical protein